MHGIIVITCTIFDLGHHANIFERAFRDFKKVSQALSKIQLQLNTFNFANKSNFSGFRCSSSL